MLVKISRIIIPSSEIDRVIFVIDGIIVCVERFIKDFMFS